MLQPSIAPYPPAAPCISPRRLIQIKQDRDDLWIGELLYRLGTRQEVAAYLGIRVGALNARICRALGRRGFHKSSQLVNWYRETQASGVAA